MARDYLKTEIVESILSEVEAGKVRVVVVNGHRFSLRKTGKEFGFIDRRTAEIRWNDTTYMSANETDGKLFHEMVSIQQGITPV